MMVARALRALKRESPFVFVSERDAPFTRVESSTASIGRADAQPARGGEIHVRRRLARDRAGDGDGEAVVNSRSLEHGVDYGPVRR